MNQLSPNLKKLIPIAAAALFLAACAPAATKPDGADALHARLLALQADPQLASRAPVALKEAEQAVQAAEQPTEDTELGQHLVLIADRKLDIASARARSRLLEDQRKTLAEQRESTRLEARTNEADRAHEEVRVARGETDAALQATQTAQQQAEELQRQIAELNAKDSERGLVVTLGDLLFATGRSDLRGSAASHLGKLAQFLNRYPARTVVIEGHTDTVGSEDYNQGLSQRRAEAVRAYLIRQGVDAGRLAAAGLGEGSPVGSNQSATGRQQNRRVEVIISNTLTSAR